MKIKTLLLSVIALLGICRPANADKIQIKLGTLAPDGSSWHLLLKQAAQEAEKAAKDWTEKNPTQPVELKFMIYAGGKMGSEGDMLTKLRVNALQAAAMSTIGMHQIAPDPQALDIPLLLDTYEERDHLLEQMKPELEKILSSKGYTVLTWSEIGFTRFFSTKARPTLADMRSAKLFSWDGDPKSTDAWKAGGFNPVVLSSVEMVTSLQTGMIDTILYPPAVVLGIRAHEKANYMLDLKWSTLTGAMIVKNDTWEKIPEKLRPAILEIFREKGKKIFVEAREMERDAISKMRSLGVTEVKVQDRAAWDEMKATLYKAINGKVVPAATFERITKILSEYRAKKGKK